VTTTERRLAKVEASLTPLELVRRWLGEAHRYSDFTAYAQALYPKGTEGLPLDRLVREARESAEAAARGRSHEERSKATQAAMRRTVFLYQLVLRIWTLAEETLEREGLRYAALSAHLALAMSDHSILGSRAEAFSKLGRAAITWATELRALETARTRVEADYFEGTSTLYPATLRRWTEQRELSDGLVDPIRRLSELDGLDPLPAGDPDRFEERVRQLVADHVEMAKAKALDEMGDGRGAVRIAIRWLAPRLD
jgi:hypothetical protein